MLTIRTEQLQALGEASARAYESALVDHCRGFAPRLHALRGDTAFRRLVRLGVSRAQQEGFDHRGPVRFWVELMLAFGSEWHSDPQLWRITRGLARREMQQNFRADLLFDGMLEHGEMVDDPARQHARASLERIGGADWAALLRPDADPETRALALLEELHPRKFEAVGLPAVHQVVQAAAGHCARLGVDAARGQVLFAGLMFGFGHGVFEDPMYPWVSQTLRPQGGAGDELRCRRLARKTRLYVRAVLQHWAA
jgi:hypothetical protein